MCYILSSTGVQNIYRTTPSDLIASNCYKKMIQNISKDLKHKEK